MRYRAVEVCGSTSFEWSLARILNVTSPETGFEEIDEDSPKPLPDNVVGVPVKT